MKCELGKKESKFKSEIIQIKFNLFDKSFPKWHYCAVIKIHFDDFDVWAFDVWSLDVSAEFT
jgi:hypothetical protein